MSLTELLAAMEKGSTAEGRPPAMAAEVLLAYGATYAAFLTGCRFSAGDLVTPLRNSNMKGAGDPHVVLEVRSAEQPYFTDETSSTGFGRRLDMRVASFYGDTIARHWVESIDFEPFKRDA